MLVSRITLLLVLVFPHQCKSLHVTLNKYPLYNSPYTAFTLRCRHGLEGLRPLLCRTRWLVRKGSARCMQLSHDGKRWKLLSTPLSWRIKVPLKGTHSVTILWRWFLGEREERPQLEKAHISLSLSLSVSLCPTDFQFSSLYHNYRCITDNTL